MYNFGKRNPLLTLGGLAAGPLMNSSGEQAPMQADSGFQMPNFNFGGGSPSSAASRLSRGRMAGYDVY